MNRKNWEGSGHVLMEVISMHLSRDTEENHKKASLRIVGISAKIRNRRLLSASLVRCCYTRLLGFCIGITGVLSRIEVSNSRMQV
jgi:hypothetical protein